MKRSGFVLAGYFGFGNAGDEMIWRAVRGSAPEADWTVLGHDAGRWNLFSLPGLFRRSEALVYGGGELFQSRTSRRSLLYYAFLPLLAKICGARFVAYGMGLDPDLEGWDLSLSIAALNRAERVWFRDEESFSIYRKGGGRSPASVAPDPAWVWPVPDAPPPDSLTRILWIPRTPGAESVRAPVLLLHPPHDGKVFGGGEPWENMEDLLPIIARHDAVVSMRYHGLVLAGLAGRPAVAVAAHGKVASMARALGCPVLSPEAPEAEVQRALRDAFARRGEIAASARALQEDARRGLASLAETLRNP